MSLDQNQKGVLRGILPAIVVMSAVLPLPLILDVAPWLEPDRSRSLLLTAVLLAAPMAICIASIARFRFFSPADIHGSGLTAGSDRIRILQSVLQNTLEQTVLAAIVQTAWILVASKQWLPVANLAAILFVAGRIFFATGYAKGAPARAFGFGLTFYPSVVLLFGASGVCLSGRLVRTSSAASSPMCLFSNRPFLCRHDSD
ncbi:MAG: MAPEG family protein [Gammaproteobacteria bacterium]|nr:MAPEG family protein [Gammaproteobacteria bacterium]